MSELHSMSAHELKELLRKKELSSLELTESVLSRVERVEGGVQAYLARNEQALDQARAVDKRRCAGEELPDLAGIPYALKDNICTRGIATTCASRMLEFFVPPYNAAVADKLHESEGVLLGKLNMDEFAMGSSTETSYFQKTKNPYDLNRVPGGSSGGSAAAVAAGEAVFALGTDTGGSIRQPASFCGVVGLKPTYGRISRFGVVAFASSLDQVGPITKDVADAAFVLRAIAGADMRDASSLQVDVPDYTRFLGQDVKGMRIGLPAEYFGSGISPGVRAAVENLAKKLEGEGAVVGECSLPRADAALAAYFIIASAEACSNLGRYDGVKYGYRAKDYSNLEDMICKTRSEGFGTEVKRRIMLGTYALSAGYFDAYYKKAQQVRTLVIQDFQKAFESYDVLLTPTAPSTAWRLGEMSDPVKMYAADICTVSVNVAGLPAMSIPIAQENGLPIGAQFIGKALCEGDLLRVGHAAERLCPGLRPTL